jgi:hypothetical protein
VPFLLRLRFRRRFGPAAGARIAIGRSLVAPHRQAQKARTQKTGKETKVAIADVQKFARRYYVEMGIDPLLVDLAGKTSAQRLYLLSRSEIASSGLETRGAYDTPWLTDENDKRFSVLKVVTQPTTDMSEYLTTKLELWCDVASGLANFGYYRQLPREGTGGESAIHLRVGTGYFTFETKRDKGINEFGRVQYGYGKQDILQRGVGKTLTLVQTFPRRENQPAEPRAIQLSTVGLAEALAEFKNHCVARALLPATSTVFPDPKPVPTSTVFPDTQKRVPTSTVFPEPHQRAPVPKVFSPPQQSESTPELSAGAGQ